MDLTIDPRIVQSPQNNPRLSQDLTSKNKQQLREAAREMEAIYINQMYSAMRKTVPDDGLIPTNSATTTFQEMLDMQMARKTAAGKGMGIGEAIYNQMKKNLK